MKKLLALVVALSVLLSVGICMAAVSEKWTADKNGVKVDRNNDGKIDGVDFYDDSGKVIKRGYDSDGDMKVDTWQTYDGNTGLPVVVKSDSAYLLQ